MKLTEICDQFRLCGYSDQEGHPIENNIAFIELDKMAKTALSITREQIIEDMKYAKYELKEAGYDDAATWWEGYIEALEFVLEYKNEM